MSRKITGRFLRLDGNPIKGHIAFRPSVQLNDVDSTSMVLPDRVSVKLDKTGAFLVKLECTDDPKWTPQGWKIKVIEQIPNGRSYFIELPYGDGSTVDISDITPVIDPGEWRGVPGDKGELADGKLEQQCSTDRNNEQ
jgi:hypothetical protein